MTLKQLKLNFLRAKWGRLVQFLLKLRAHHEEQFDLLQFIRRFDRDFQRSLLVVYDPARVMLLKHLQDVLNLPTSDLLRIAVVSGSEQEPELHVIRAAQKGSISVDYLNYSEDPETFDLTKPWTGPMWQAYLGKYDIVLCEQVLEHVVEPKTAVQNLVSLVNENGFLHLSIPALNNRHGAPEFFFAGFSLETIRHFTESAGMKIDQSCVWSSRKGARMYATTDWSPLAISGPIVFLVEAVQANLMEARLIRSILARRLKHSLIYPFQQLFPLKRLECPVAISVICRRRG